MFAMFLIMWYLVSIIGLSVHSCSAENISFIAPAFINLTCENTHGDDAHHCHNHHHHSDESCDNGCCDNEVESLDLSGKEPSSEIDVALVLPTQSFVLFEDLTVHPVWSPYGFLEKKPIAHDFYSMHCIFLI